MGTLRIAVAGTILGPSLVGRVLAHASVLVHLDKVEGTVQATRKFRDVDVEGEFLVLQTEHLVRGFILQKIDARADVLLLAGRDEFESEGVSAGGDAVCFAVLGPI